MENLSQNELATLGLWFMNSMDKTASNNSLVIDAYVNGLEQGLGIEGSLENSVKTASQALGREFMFNVASMFMLNK